MQSSSLTSAWANLVTGYRRLQRSVYWVASSCGSAPFWSVDRALLHVDCPMISQLLSSFLSACLQVLEQLTGQQPVFGKARYTVRTFGIRRNEKISCFVTVRGEKALQLIVSLPSSLGATTCTRPNFQMQLDCVLICLAPGGCMGNKGSRLEPVLQLHQMHNGSSWVCGTGEWPEGEGVRASAKKLLGFWQLWCAYHIP